MNQSCQKPLTIGKLRISRCTVSYLIIAALLAVPLVLALGSSAGATTDPSADQTATADVPQIPVPAFITTWLTTEGLSAITTSEGSGLSPENLAAVVPGHATAVWQWTEDYISGDPWADPVSHEGVWAVPLTLVGEPVGAMVMETNGNTVASHTEEWEASVGEALTDVGGAAVIMERDPHVWFLLDEGLLRPVNATARQILAGSLPLDDYQRYLVQRLGDTGGTAVDPADAATPSLTPTLVVAGVMTLLLGLTALVVWLRRPTEAP